MNRSLLMTAALALAVFPTLADPAFAAPADLAGVEKQAVNMSATSLI